MLTLALKEIRDSLLTLRFLAGTAFAVLLVAVSVWALADDYGRRVAGHSRTLALNEAHMAEYGHLNRTGSAQVVGAAPRPMSVWVRGLSQGTHLEQFDNDPLPVLFPLVDVVAIVTVVFSLLALVFTFDLVSGERRAGTLRLLSSFGLSRPALIGGKLLGAAGTIAVPYVGAWLTAALVAALASPAPWTATEWGAAAAIGAGGLLYVLDFAALGLAVSTLTYRPRSSAFAVLAAWVALVLVVPNLAPFVAAEIRPLPSLTTLQRQISRMLDTERDALQAKLRDEAFERLRAEDPAVGRYLRLDPSERAEAAAADPADPPSPAPPRRSPTPAPRRCARATASRGRRPTPSRPTSTAGPTPRSTWPRGSRSPRRRRPSPTWRPTWRRPACATTTASRPSRRSSRSASAAGPTPPPTASGENDPQIRRLEHADRSLRHAPLHLPERAARRPPRRRRALARRPGGLRAAVRRRRRRRLRPLRRPLIPRRPPRCPPSPRP